MTVLGYLEWDLHGRLDRSPVRMRTPVYDVLPAEARVGETAVLKLEEGTDGYYVWLGTGRWHRSGGDGSVPFPQFNQTGAPMATEVVHHLFTCEFLGTEDHMTCQCPRHSESERFPVKRWFCRIEWKPQDLWVGVFWKRQTGYRGLPSLDVWVCLLPMLPIHFGHKRWSAPSRREPQ